MPDWVRDNFFDGREPTPAELAELEELWQNRDSIHVEREGDPEMRLMDTPKADLGTLPSTGVCFDLDALITAAYSDAPEFRIDRSEVNV